MPRSASQSSEDVLQGNLFGAPEPAAAAPASREPAASSHDLSDDELGADAAARPRQRQTTASEHTPAAPLSTDPDPNPQDEPAWAHHSQVDPQQLTPMLRHYVELKTAHPERVLLYRLGDFFECFFDDAIELSRVLELTLTGKDGGKAIGRVPMAGIPHHAAERYCTELIKRGYSVALCDQLETTPAKGALLKRDITRVLTPGTVLEEGMLSARRNNWLAAVVVEPAQGKQPLRWGLASADVSTGEVQVMQRQHSSALHQHLAQQEASELLWIPGDDDASRPAWCPERLRLTPMARTPFSPAEAQRTLLQHYRLSSLDGLGLTEHPLAQQALGGLLHYLQDTQPLEENSRIPLEVPAIQTRGPCPALLRVASIPRTHARSCHRTWVVQDTRIAAGVARVVAFRCIRRAGASAEAGATA